MGLFGFIANLIKLEKLAVYLYAKYAAYKKAKTEADIPLTNAEEAEDLKNL